MRKTTTESRDRHDTTLGALTEESVRHTGPPESGTFVYVDIGSIDNEAKAIVSPKTLPVSKAPTRARQNLESGDVLVSLTRPNLNAVAMVPDELSGAVGSTGFHVLRARDVESRWLFYAVQDSAFVDNMSSLVQGALYPAVRPKDVRAHRVLPPSRAKQQQIVGEIEKQFTRLDAAAWALRRVQVNLKRYRAAVLKAACEGRLVPTEAELAKQEGRVAESGQDLLQDVLEKRRRGWVGRGIYKEPEMPTTNVSLPEGWALSTLDAIAAVKGGITKDQNRKHESPARLVPYLRVANVQRGYLDLTEVKEVLATNAEISELALQRGDVLFNEGGDRDKLGRGWIWNGDLPECIHQNHVFRARPFDKRLNPKFLSWYSNSFGQKFFFQEGKHTTNLASISMTKLKALPVRIPPADEQERIVAEVERCLSVADAMETAIATNLARAAKLRQSVLQQAFHGELLPRSAAKRTARTRRKVPSYRPML